MRAVVDQERCQGHGQCYRIAPDLFDLDGETGLSEVRLDPVPDEWEDAAEKAQICCPERAITLED